MEKKYENVLPPGKSPDKYLLPVRFFRGKQSTPELLLEAYSRDFKLAEDDKFIFLDPELDNEGSCGSESCEVYSWDNLD